MNFTKLYIDNVTKSLAKLDKKKVLEIINILKNLRKLNGRLFIIGVGGSAGNASHAVNDFRKLCNIDTYTPVDMFQKSHPKPTMRVLILYLILT